MEEMRSKTKKMTDERKVLAKRPETKKSNVMKGLGKGREMENESVKRKKKR